MRLLEERTAASKHEMDLAESLEELKELNRRFDFLPKFDIMSNE